MAKAHYVFMQPGDQLVVDIGDWGLRAKISRDKSYYDVEYVKIRATRTTVQTEMVPADVVVRRGRQRSLIKQATKVQIWRHGPRRPR